MRKRAIFFDTIALILTSAIVVYGLQYAYVVYTFDLTTLIISVILPLCLGSFFLALTGERILVYAFLAYIWAVVDDMPVFFDSVLTWPEVTRFHPFLPRLFMNIVIHGLTIGFLYLAIREALKGRTTKGIRMYSVALLVLVAFVLAYAQNLPLNIIQNLVENSWYPFDLAEKLASLAVFGIAVYLSKTSQRQAPPPTPSKIA